MKRYIHAQQVWDKAKCEKLVKRIATDGLGTRYGFRGYVGDLIGKTTDYNGGCVRDGKWYVGEVYPLPELADGFEIVVRPSWGYQLVKKDAA